MRLMAYPGQPGPSRLGPWELSQHPPYAAIPEHDGVQRRCCDSVESCPLSTFTPSTSSSSSLSSNPSCSLASRKRSKRRAECLDTMQRPCRSSSSATITPATSSRPPKKPHTSVTGITLLVSSCLYAASASAAPNPLPSYNPSTRTSGSNSAPLTSFIDADMDVKGAVRMPEADASRTQDFSSYYEELRRSVLESQERAAHEARRKQMDAQTKGRTPSPSRVVDTAGHVPLRKMSKRVTNSSAYSSGIIADWTHQSRSVWFQRKAIIITSCFLAIFIVLIIGAAVFLRDRKSDGEYDDEDLDEDDDDEFSDAAALRRMREERRMRSGTEAKKKLQAQAEAEGGEKEGHNSSGGGRDTAYGVDQAAQRRKRGRRKNGEGGDSSGSSTAVSRRFVSKWIRATPGMMRQGTNGSQTSSSGGGAGGGRGSTNQQNDAAGAADDSRSIRSSRSTASRGSRLGERRSERVDVEYHGGETANPVPSGSSGRAGDVSNLETSSSNGATSSRPGSSPRAAGNADLDQSDLQAADDAAVAEHMPPAYIPSSPGASASAPRSRPTYERPLAGELRGDAKGSAHQSDGAQASSSSAAVPSSVMEAMSRQQQQQQPQDTSSSNGGEDDASHSAHLAIDDKNRLAALAASASAPAPAPAAPRYSADDNGEQVEEAGEVHDADAPSAPTLEDAFDAESGTHVAGHRPSVEGQGQGQGQYGSTGKEKGKSSSHAAGGVLPAPPSPHSQSFSPFDQPYKRGVGFGRPSESSRYPQSPLHRAPSGTSTGPVQSSPLRQTLNRQSTQPNVASGEPNQETGISDEDEESRRRAARRAEKEREANAELAAVTASSPSDFAPRRPSQPETGSGGGGQDDAGAGESLPAYAQHRRPSQATGVGNTAQEDSTASAPDVDSILLHDSTRDHGQDRRDSDAGAGANVLSEPQPSAPPLDEEGDDDHMDESDERHRPSAPPIAADDDHP